MLFNSLDFCGFFGIVLGVYWLVPGRRPRLVWLLLASVYFYTSWKPDPSKTLFPPIFLILFSASIDYLAGTLMERIEKPWKRRLLLVTSISTNLGLLAFFKYANFILTTVHTVQGCLGLAPSGRLLHVILPLGISFYTFETISYLVDVYKNRVRAVRDPLEYAIYILFFPHLVAGPIVRPRDFLPQLRRRHRFNWDRMQLGLQFLLLGLVKKTALADNLAAIIDPVFAAPGSFSTGASWLAVLAYSAQIYLDFSGYSDMAVGLAHTLGYRLPRNFNMPYLADNIADFWRRWHISLSSWLRDYLFIPLGGSRGGTWRTCRNLFATMLLGGLWHGASWTFVAWGAFHGSLLVGYKLLPAWKWREAPSFQPLARLGTFTAVCIGWVFFRAQTFADAGTILRHLFWPVAARSLAAMELWTLTWVFAAVVAGHLLGALGHLRRRERTLPEPVIGAALVTMLLLALLLAPDDGKTFLYFQF